MGVNTGCFGVLDIDGGARVMMASAVFAHIIKNLAIIDSDLEIDASNVSAKRQDPLETKFWGF